MTIAVAPAPAELTRWAIERRIADASTEHTRTTLVAAVQARLEIASLPVPTSEARAFAIGTASVSTAILNAHAWNNNWHTNGLWRRCWCSHFENGFWRRSGENAGAECPVVWHSDVCRILQYSCRCNSSFCGIKSRLDLLSCRTRRACFSGR